MQKGALSARAAICLGLEWRSKALRTGVGVLADRYGPDFRLRSISTALCTEGTRAGLAGPHWKS